MSFWQRLLRALGYRPKLRLSFHADQEMIRSLQSLADHEQRQADEVAADLLSHALAQQQDEAVNLRCWRTLSQREQQVAALICLSYTNRQIASHLVVSTETAKTHVANALRKFGLHSKAELRRALADWDFSAWVD
ncbi:MAG: hypothetical protein A2Z45_03545 [Chloroflexi bacterium RBG_19FT_COMBO_55_16]|nr:MAG: hypothetical protein A2Z45_03545 [Chloroflexi bacterium RBG_19FT_COMBO_55_16]